MTKRSTRIAVGAAIAFLQFVAANLATLLLSFAFPGMGPESDPVGFSGLLGATFSLGILAVGWLALSRKWLIAEPTRAARIVLTLVGTYVPLGAAIAFDQVRVASPFFTVALLTGILGFHLGGLRAKR